MDIQVPEPLRVVSEPLRVLFLDFDGVLNNHQTKQRYRKDGQPGGATIGFDPRNVAVLNQFLESARVKIVVTSSWRWNHTLEELRAVLRAAGVRGEVIDATSTRSPGSRGREIQAWLDQHGPVEAFVIIDDSADMDHLLPKLARTSMETGMREKHVPLAFKILSEPIPNFPEALVIKP